MPANPQLKYWTEGPGKEEGIQEGDVLVTNHPQLAGGSHLPDITVITPVFREGEIVFYVASRGANNNFNLNISAICAILHLPDMAVITPVFNTDEIVFYMACQCRLCCFSVKVITLVTAGDLPSMCSSSRRRDCLQRGLARRKAHCSNDLSFLPSPRSRRSG